MRKRCNLCHRLTEDGRFPIHIGDQSTSYEEAFRHLDGVTPKPGTRKDWQKALQAGQGERRWLPTRKYAIYRVARRRKITCEGVTGLLVLDDLNGLSGLLTVYNKHIQDRRNCGRSERLAKAAFPHPVDLEWAVKALDRVIKMGARVILIASETAHYRSPGAPIFDHFWACLSEADGIVGLHTAQSSGLNLFTRHPQPRALLTSDSHVVERPRDPHAFRT